MEQTLIVGCGDVGLRAARLLLAHGHPVLGVVRRAERAQALEREGIPVQRADLDVPEEVAGLPLAGARVIYLAQPPQPGVTDPRMGHFLAACAGAPPRRIVYISTTGVYGDRQGAEVDEGTPVNPQTDRARRRMHAERQLGEFAAAHPTEVIILRVPGIYGPGRLPLDRIRSGTPVICPEDAPPGNRIHADDLAALCVAALDRGAPGEVFNVGDAEHASMTAFIYTVADLAGLPRPPCVPMAEADRHISPGMMSFIRESRIINADKGLRVLGVQLRHPDIASGIRHSLEQEGQM
ncbi:NAD(P)-dependent oxidoreductase [Thioalkalivibrio denitrificans]|uniref:NAD(P)-dependent oxidoreductase n=1 Tax=Thioalkalivibrio denitrificans TaxID=108003 RepID=A0A1V3NJW3_9GAMM|nr:SDR family oxidoreductase [Thioalkalivibrio denitrificans]OOG25046.1 NAD(P)-dependent oxidoreductase [Thioalkalivibrio denitrificans]